MEAPRPQLQRPLLLVLQGHPRRDLAPLEGGAYEEALRSVHAQLTKALHSSGNEAPELRGELLYLLY